MANEIIEEMKKKVFISRFSDAEVIFVDSIEELTEEQLADKTKAYFDGMSLLDTKAEVQDDISSVVSITNRGRYVNLQDYYSRHGAYEENSNKFLEAIKKLKDKEISNTIEDIQDEAVIKVLNKSIDELNLSLRASNCLKNLRCITIGDITKKTEDDLSKVRGFGKGSLMEVKEKLNELGLSLGMKNRNSNFEESIQDEDSDETVIKVLNKSIEELNLSVRSSNCLKNSNIRTIGELTKKTEDDLVKTRNFGKNSLLEIKTKLHELGLTLGMKNKNSNKS